MMAQKTLFISDVQIFDGMDKKTMMGNVLIVYNLISNVSAEPIVINNGATVTIIDGKGKFLMPGMIDAHTTVDAIPMNLAMVSDISHFLY